MDDKKQVLEEGDDTEADGEDLSVKRISKHASGTRKSPRHRLYRRLKNKRARMARKQNRIK